MNTGVTSIGLIIFFIGLAPVVFINTQGQLAAHSMPTVDDISEEISQEPQVKTASVHNVDLLGLIMAFVGLVIIIMGMKLPY
ncbi:hypothetical protein ACFL1B_00675 [Nanoarchaeota archaeon]